MSDNGGPATTYCYNSADRLTSTNDARYSSISYDSHGNTTTLGSQTMTYDMVDRHITTVDGGTTVTYIRDATDRIVARTVGGVTTRYVYSGPSDSPSAVTDASNVVLDKTIGLLGGVSKNIRGGTETWNYSNIHGDNVAQANSAGAKVGSTFVYDPYGQALSGNPDTKTGNFDDGWLGSHQRMLEHEGTINTIEMGARQYVPGLGRFLEVDPIEGGSANDYEYCNGDAVNCMDLSGESAGWNMNQSEKSFCGNFRNQLNCYRFRLASILAIRHTAGLTGGLANAARHVIWSAMMTWYMGPAAAQGFMNRHELGESTISRDHIADVWNNAVGKSIGIAAARKFRYEWQARDYVIRETLRVLREKRLDLNCGGCIR